MQGTGGTRTRSGLRRRSPIPCCRYQRSTIQLQRNRTVNDMASQSAFAFLQKIGKCMMLPVSVLPVAGILLGVGSAEFPWLPDALSQVMAASGNAIFANLPLLFAIGVAIGLTENDGVAALAGTVGYVVFLAALGIFAKLRGIETPLIMGIPSI